MAILAGTADDKVDMVRKVLGKVHYLLRDDPEVLNMRIAQLEVLGKLRGLQKIILEEEQNMPFIYDLEVDIRYNQGLEKGIQKGVEQATHERNMAFAKNLILHTDHDDSSISAPVNVPVEFVTNLRAALHKKH